MNKVALFDFCETIANFQTADAFIDYVRAHDSRSSVKVWYFIHVLLKKLKIIKVLSLFYPYSSVNKRIYALQLRGIKINKLEEFAKDYYTEIVKPNLIKITVDVMTQLRERGYRILIVSGGYNLYLNNFADEYHISRQDVVSTRFKYVNGVCTGKFEGHDCLFDEKVNRLNNLFGKEKIYSIAFSDSKSDEPLLEWADEGIVVRNKNKKKWTNKYQELIWE